MKIALLVSAVIAVSASWGDVLDELLPAPRVVERLGENDRTAGLQSCGAVRIRGLVAPQQKNSCGTVKGAYILEITTNGVTVTANDAEGERYAKATLEQLEQLSPSLPCCKITDWPEFPYRGLMIDSGRNFHSLELIRDLLRHMAAYKMNVFHWHLTDEHGWRLESKVHPEMQSEKSFGRYAGRFYTQAEFKEIVAFAASLGITVIPELDVPGHSGAFRRALGIEKMDSPGVDKVVCELIDELCSLESKERMPFVHLGTDEVHKDCEEIPAEWYMLWGNRVTANGRTLLGWSPGHHLDGVKGEYIRDVWGWGWDATDGTKPYFDSTGHYYINHVDPLEMLSGAVYQQPCKYGTDKANKLGPMLGIWHDDITAGENALAKEIAVWPGVVMFSDSFWRGRERDYRHYYGRLPFWDTPDFQLAVDLERRVIAHRDRIFKDSKYAFDYVKQTNLRWRMTDTESDKGVHRKIAQATVYPYHFRFPNSWFVNKKQGRVTLETWIKSSRERDLGAWIGFTAYSRSSGRIGESGMPLAGWWSRHGSTVELNSEKIVAPKWNNAGAPKNGLAEVALTDEEYYLREPTPIHLKAGWNHVKLTVDKHLEKTWKWVATFVPVEKGADGRVREARGLEYSAEAPLSTSFGGLGESVYSHAPFSPVDLGYATWRRIDAADRTVDEQWAALKDKTDYERFRKEVRAKAIEAMGGLPEKTPLDAKVTEKIKRDGYTVEKLYYHSRPGVPVTALLYLPDEAKFKPPYAAVVVACGHDVALGKLNPGYQRACVLAAKAGMASIIYDAIDQGERRQVLRLGGTVAHCAVGIREFLLGESMMKVRLWDGIRTIDYLETRKEIDMNRVGVMGNSGGGTLSSYIAAFDQRVKAGAPSCFISSIRAVCRDDGPQDAEQNLFGCLTFGYNHLALLMLNDNAMCVNYSTGDFFPIDGGYSTYGYAKTLSEKLGRGDKVAMIDVPGPHGWKESARTGSIQWMQKWLNGRVLVLDLPALRALDRAFDPKTADMGLGPVEGLVAPNGQVKNLPGFRSYYGLLNERLDVAERKRSGENKTVVASGIVPSAPRRLAMTCTGSETCAGGEKRYLVFTRPDGAMFPAVLIEPEGATTAAVFAGDAGRGEFDWAVEGYLKAKKAVLAVDLSGFGEAGVPDHWYPYGSEHSADGAAVMLNLLGEHLVGHRAAELIGIAARMKERYGSVPELTATGEAVIPAAHVKACDPSAYRFITLRRPCASWTEFFRNPEIYGMKRFANVVRGALFVYDWPELL